MFVHCKDMKHGWIWFVLLLILSFRAEAGETDIQPSADKVNAKAKAVILEAEGQRTCKVCLKSISIRGTFSSTDVVGSVAPEKFQEYDIAATFRLPWSWYTASGWGVCTRLMVGAGTLYSSGEAGLVVSLLPLFAFGSRDGRCLLDLGAGAAVLSKDRFGEQDFGSPFQFSLSAGLSVPIFKRIGLGYRFLHYSDAGLNGPDSTGADLHMFELIYRF
jgi:hypothetical protein